MIKVILYMERESSEYIHSLIYHDARKNIQSAYDRLMDHSPLTYTQALEIQFLLKVARMTLLRYLQGDCMYRSFARFTGNYAYEHLKRNLENILKVDMTGTNNVRWYSYYLTRLDSCVDAINCYIEQLGKTDLVTVSDTEEPQL